MGEVILVCGPPCAGKSRWAAEHAGPGDRVLDWDTLAVQLGSPVSWHHPEPYASRAERQLQAAAAEQIPGRTYLIRSAPAGPTRAALRRITGATRQVLLDPGLEVCLDRAEADRRPAQTSDQIRSWYARFSPSSHDDRCL